MKSVLVALILALGCNDQSAAPPPGGGSGVPPILGTGNTGGSGPDDAGVDAGVDAGIDGGVSRGACDNARDLVAIASAGGVRDTSLSCSAIACAYWFWSPTQYETCINSCIETAVPSLSAECAACYGGLERCSLEAECSLFCVNNDTCNVECANCLVDKGCSKAFTACRGLPGDGCPSSG
jgi:hypothetical protein